MRPKSIVLLVLALGCGLIASIGINQVLANRSQQQAPTQDTTSIYVAQTQIELGAKVTPEMLKLEPWPKTLVPAGAIEKMTDLEGRMTKTRIYPGEPVLNNKLFSRGDTTAGPTVLIPDGHRVTPVKVDAVSGGSGLLQPGDRVDVLVYLEKNEAKNIPISGTITLLQNIRVFAVNAQFRRENDDNEGMAMAKTVSLLLTPDNVELVTLAANMGDIQLVMRSPQDEEVVETLKGLTARDIFNMSGMGDSKDEDLLDGTDPLLAALGKEPEDVTPEPETAAVEIPDAEPDWTMTMVQDGVASRVTFIQGYVHIEPLNQNPSAKAQPQQKTPTADQGNKGEDVSEPADDKGSDEDNADFEEFNFDDDGASVG